MRWALWTSGRGWRRHGGVADQVVPAVDGDLAGDQGGAAAVAFLDDLEQIAALLGTERLEAPVVEDEQLDAAERPHEPGIAAVAAGEREIGEQLGDALVEDRAVVAAGLVAERAGEPTLADAGRAFDDQVLRLLDPVPAGERLEQGAIEAACGAVVDVLDDGVVAQPGIAQPGLEPPVVAIGGLAVEQQAEPFGMGEVGRAWDWLRARRRPGPCRAGRAAEADRGWDG